MRGSAGVITQVSELLLYKQHEVPLLPLVDTKLISHSISLKYGSVGHYKLLIFCSLMYKKKLFYLPEKVCIYFYIVVDWHGDKLHDLATIAITAQMCVTPNITNFPFSSMCSLCPK